MYPCEKYIKKALKVLSSGIHHHFNTIIRTRKSLDIFKLLAEAQERQRKKMEDFCHSPIAVDTNGFSKTWHRYGKLHRDDGPAVESPDGMQMWYREGKLHREDGPAIVWPCGKLEWYRNGKRHREGGPAVEHPNGMQEWYLNDVSCNEQGVSLLLAFDRKIQAVHVGQEMRDGSSEKITVSRPLLLKRTTLRS